MKALQDIGEYVFFSKEILLCAMSQFCNGVDLCPFCCQHYCHRGGNSNGWRKPTHPNQSWKSWEIQAAVPQVSGNPLNLPRREVWSAGGDEELDNLEYNSD